MSGIDFGTRNCVVAQCKRRRIEIVTDTMSKRLHPSMVCFTRTERFIGSDAVSKRPRNLKNTVCGPKRLLGLDAKDRLTVEERKFTDFKIIGEADGRAAVQVKLPNMSEQSVLSPERVSAMILARLEECRRDFVQDETRNEVVIAVPQFWDARQRQSILDACRIAGVKCIGVLDETAAIALSFGLIQRALLPTPESKDPAKTIVFVDMGYSATQLCCCRMVQGDLNIVCDASEPCLGGRNFDRALATHFMHFLEETEDIFVDENPRAKLRLLEAVTRTKEILSTNEEAPVYIETVMEDIGLDEMLSREDFNSICSDLIEKFREVCSDLKSKMDTMEIDHCESVVILGGSTRIPAIQAVLKETFEVEELSRTSQPDESIAKGCALQCATKSVFYDIPKTKLTFHAPQAITITYPRPDGTVRDYLLIKKGDAVPKTRKFPVKVQSDFEISAHTDAGFHLGTWRFSGFPEETELDGAQKCECLIYIQYDFSKLIHIQRAVFTWSKDVQVEVEREVPIEVEETAEEPECVPMESTDIPSPSPTATPMPVDVPEAEAMEPATPISEEGSDETAETATSEPPAEEPPKPTTKKIKVMETRVRKQERKLAITVQTFGLSEEAIAHEIENEGALMQADILLRQTRDAKNALESYCYATLEHLDGKMREFVLPEKWARLKPQIEECVDWLYQEGRSAELKDYERRLKKFKKVTDSVEARFEHADLREHKMSKLEATIEEVNVFVTSGLAGEITDLAHLTQDDWKTVSDKTQEAQTWFEETSRYFTTLPKTEDSVIGLAVIDAKRNELFATMRTAQNKPKPKPEPKPESAPKGSSASSEDAETSEGTSSTSAETQSKAEAPSMEAAETSE